MARIVPITLPTPYQIGDVNVYFVEDERPMLIDAGPPDEGARTILREKLKALGYEFRDLKGIVVTHFHPDHFGLAQVIAAEAGIPIHMHPLELYLQRTRSEKAQKVFCGWDLPATWDSRRIDPSRWIPSSYRPFGVTFTPVDDDEMISTGEMNFEIHFSPGHSLGHVVLREKGTGWLFSGDTLMQKVVPNPFIYHVEGERVPTLPIYLESLHKLRGLRVDKVFPAHGEPFEDLPAVVDAICEHFLQKTVDVYEILRDIGEGSLLQISQQLYPLHIDREAYMVMSKTLGCLDMLRQINVVHSAGDHYTLFSAKNSDPGNKGIQEQLKDLILPK
ncbi:MBL fold metallo-hydrolase [Heliobacillus mobilis]|uniref:MBL fold metallo-hydrolase n=1 Tax=Heliobacterium mobile TaxID=28064 RepID=A0A6I3SJP9_HELMO|nr:MBL fold metallo-hydrolase [Heliobacterium mobile]MTV49119.1 MBL fold metallo-hydrolase [Heliobacterium mobile]